MAGETTLSGKYATYPEYKESGVEMLGALPVSWQTKQVRYLLKDGAEGIKIGPFGSALKLEDMVITGTRVYGQENVIKKDFTLGKRKISQDKFKEMQVYQVYPDDLLITMMGTSGKCELVPQDADVGIIDSHLLRMRVKEEKILPRFFRLLIDECYEIENQIKISGKGSIMHGLNSSIVKSLTLPLPSYTEQEVILNFLDHETDKIDTLIEKQQQLIKLLKEKRQAVISHAVTKGLSNKEQPNAPMRDSGIEWLGEVPEHWPMPKVSQIAKVLNGSTPDKTNLSYWESGTIPWLASGCLNSEIINEPSLLISEGAYQNCSVELIPANSLLVGMVGQGKTRGTSAILSFDSCINQNMAAIMPSKKVQVRFLYFLFQAMYENLRELGRGGNQAALNCEIIGSIRIPLPSFEEQLSIVSMLDELLIKLNNADKLGEEQIELLKERRTALISAAVTGKIDVRHFTSKNRQAPKSSSSEGTVNDR